MNVGKNVDLQDFRNACDVVANTEVNMFYLEEGVACFVTEKLEIIPPS